jgi:hypothetical protein
MIMMHPQFRSRARKTPAAHSELVESCVTAQVVIVAHSSPTSPGTEAAFTEHSQALCTAVTCHAVEHLLAIALYA